MRRLPWLAAGAATLLLAATAAPASAHGKHDSDPTATTIVGGLVGPLSLAVGPHGTTFVTENFAGLLDAVSSDGTKTPLYAADAEVGGVSYRPGVITFTETGPTQTVKQLRTNWKGQPTGSPTVLADVGAYEAAKNPDAGTTYGFRDLPDDCLSQIPADFPIPVKYTGLVDSHPYATTSIGPFRFLADAGANAILSIDRKGKVRTVAVLPAQPTVVPQEVAEGLGLPACTFGATYWFEPVPTDVEVGPRGQLFVTTLPGGPEDASLGARGAVYTVNPFSGKVKQYASGFLGATDLAVSPSGKVYVTQLFGGEISTVDHGAPKTFFQTPLPSAVEWSPHGLFATVNALPEGSAPPDGQLVRITVPRGSW